jgi:S1-C subfamily serine protease
LGTKLRLLGDDPEEWTYGDDGKISGSGSGFLVRADGRILTNFHVIEHTKRATVRLANEDAYDAVHVLAVDKAKGYCPALDRCGQPKLPEIG